MTTDERQNVLSSAFDPGITQFILEFVLAKRPQLLADGRELPKVKPMTTLARAKLLIPTFDLAPRESILRPFEKNPKATDPVQPLAGKKKKGWEPPTLDTIAEKLARPGPLSLLHQWFSSERRVRVLVRSARGLRGLCTGYLVGIDKHHNLVPFCRSPLDPAAGG